LVVDQSLCLFTFNYLSWHAIYTWLSRCYNLWTTSTIFTILIFAIRYTLVVDQSLCLFTFNYL